MCLCIALGVGIQVNVIHWARDLRRNRSEGGMKQKKTGGWDAAFLEMEFCIILWRDAGCKLDPGVVLTLRWFLLLFFLSVICPGVEWDCHLHWAKETSLKKELAWIILFCSFEWQNLSLLWWSWKIKLILLSIPTMLLSYSSYCPSNKNE